VIVSMQVSGGWSGGFGQGRRPKTVDTEKLAAADADEGVRLAEAVQCEAGAAAGGAAQPNARAPEAMIYTLAVEGLGGARTLKGNDADLSPAFASLIDWIERHAQPEG